MTQLSNVPMQPNPSAVERPLTLIEKLKEIYDMLCCKAEDEEDECFASTYRANVDGFKWALDIVKQHSDWVSVNERLPPNVTDEEKNYLLLIHKEWGCFIIGQYIKENDEINSYMGNDPISDFAYWMPIPQPPSEVQDD